MDHRVSRTSVEGGNWHARIDAVFAERPLFSWLMIGTLLLYLVVAGAMFISVIANYYGLTEYTFGADSNTYYVYAELDSQAASSDDDRLITFGQNLFGPVLLAKLVRGPVGVGLFNLAIFFVLLQASGAIPGVRRKYFFILLAINAMTIASITTLNKEIFAMAGVVLFAKYIYSEKRSVLLFLAFVILSVMARWEQALILFIYLFFESRFSLLKGKHKTALALLTLMLSIAYPAALKLSSIDLTSFLAQLQVGVIIRLNAIQAVFGGYLITVIPKSGMLILGGFLTPAQYIPTVVNSVSPELQNRLVVPLSNLAMIGVSIVAFLRGSLRPIRPLGYLALMYMIVIAINPFIQSRYAFPVYVIICIELSRSKEGLELVRPLFGRFSLPPSYLRVLARRSERVSCANPE